MKFIIFFDVNFYKDVDFMWDIFLLVIKKWSDGILEVEVNCK